MIVSLVLLLLTAQAPPQSAEAWKAAGFRALRAGAAEEASADFGQALRINAADAVTLLGAGAAANMRGRADDARQHLAGALQLQPSLTAASLLLGDILYRGADLRGAIAVYEQALLYAPRDRQVTARLEAWRHEAEVQEGFSTRVATHFTILFEGPPDQPMATRVADILESAYWKVGAVLGAYPADVITVVLYSREQFRDVTQSPSWAGGVYDGRIRIPIAGKTDERELRRVLTHEFTHAVVYSLAARRVPQWLNEGLAVLMERGGALEPSGRGPESVLPLTRLEGSFERFSPEDARTAYATSAAATEALIDRAGPTVIYNLLTNLGNGLPLDEAFERAALMPYPEFVQSWR